MKRLFILIVSLLILSLNSNAQSNLISSYKLNGKVLTENNNPIAYVNIILLENGKGSISNQNGDYAIDISSIDDTNTIRFQCIGYNTIEYKFERLKRNPKVLLSENVYKLDEILVLGSTPDVRKIVKSILNNKKKNYNNATKKQKVFYRERSSGKILNLKLNSKKNDISEITPEILKIVENKIPKHTQSYADLLSNLYNKKSEFKFEPIMAVKLEGEKIEELKSFNRILKNLIKDTEEKEYWQIKTGLLKYKIPSSENDSSDTESMKRYYKRKIKSDIDFVTFKDKKRWDFLYKIDKYNFEIIGGTKVNDESVYIIEFTPKEEGLFEGKLYVSIETSALIRADYKYAIDKTGLNIQIFGFGMTQTDFVGSIYFEKNKDTYNLKYFSFQNDSKFNVNRKISLQKKKKQVFFNKKINEIKLDVDLTIERQESIELLVIDKAYISDIQFDQFVEKNDINITYVDQFDNTLWKNHITIEPTQNMRKYKKSYY